MVSTAMKQLMEMLQQEEIQGDLYEAVCEAITQGLLWGIRRRY